jgi:hypothetical protein
MSRSSTKTELCNFVGFGQGYGLLVLLTIACCSREHTGKQVRYTPTMSIPAAIFDAAFKGDAQAVAARGWMCERVGLRLHA